MVLDPEKKFNTHKCMLLYFWSEDAEWLGLRQEILNNYQMIKYEKKWHLMFSHQFWLWIETLYQFFQCLYPSSPSLILRGIRCWLSPWEKLRFFYTSVFRQIWEILSYKILSINFINHFTNCILVSLNIVWIFIFLEWKHNLWISICQYSQTVLCIAGKSYSVVPCFSPWNWLTTKLMILP